MNRNGIYIIGFATFFFLFVINNELQCIVCKLCLGDNLWVDNSEPYSLMPSQLKLREIGRKQY